MNDESEGIWKESAVCQFKISIWHLQETEEKNENLKPVSGMIFELGNFRIRKGSFQSSEVGF
jgi:hypothetical protein